MSGKFTLQKILESERKKMKLRDRDRQTSIILFPYDTV